MLNSRVILLGMLAAVVTVSGCIESNPTNLDSDFELNYTESDLDITGDEAYQESISAVEDTDSYSLNADNKMAMNLPVVSVSVNMTSEGVFRTNSSEINSSGIIGFDVSGNSNSTDFSSNAVTDEDSTTITLDGNTTEYERFDREELGISMESLKTLGVEDASLLGETTIDQERLLLLDLDINSSDLMRLSSDLFEKHSPLEESTESAEDQQMEDLENFDETKAYLWLNKENYMPKKFSYYGSAGNNSVQIRSETEYRNN